MIHARPFAVAALLTMGLVFSSVPASAQAPAWKDLFNNGSLDGFQIVSGSASYKVVDGVLVGTTTEGSPNTFLATNAPLKDFEFEFEVKVDDELNSGIQVRSHLAKEGEKPEGAGGPLPAGRLYGPQCEISLDGHAGNFYDEARRGVWWSGLTSTDAIRTDAARAAFKKGEWNSYRIVVVGDHFQSWINGVPTADFRQPHDPEGHIGFQVHSIAKGTGPYSVRWRSVRLKNLD